MSGNTIRVESHGKNTGILKLSYGEVSRYITLSELENINQGITIWCMEEEKTLIQLTADCHIEMEVSPEMMARLVNRLEIGAHKKKINLSPLLSISVHGNIALRTYNDVSPFFNYWKDKEDVTQRTARLFKQLSEDLIEIPYADAPNEYDFRRTIAFHTNHGTAHALRSANLMKHLCSLTLQSGREPTYTKDEPILNEEELACLELAAFLFRSGRTNELGWSDDPTYSPRGAAIFAQIALELGFSETLIAALAQAFDFKNENNLEESIKIARYRALFHITHTCELIRCYTNGDYLFEQCTEDLSALLSIHSKEARLSLERLFEFAETQCTMTGAPIMTKGFKSFGNPYILVSKSNKPEETYKELDDFRRGYELQAISDEQDSNHSQTLEYPIAIAQETLPEPSLSLITPG